jgi:hypothetical protein
MRTWLMLNNTKQYIYIYIDKINKRIYCYTTTPNMTRRAKSHVLEISCNSGTFDPKTGTWNIANSIAHSHAKQTIHNMKIKF